MYKPLISIIVPAYNSSRYIDEALDSCLRQDYENLELVISDDTSQDGTVERIELWLNEHQQHFIRSECFLQQTNLGVKVRRPRFSWTRN